MLGTVVVAQKRVEFELSDIDTPEVIRFLCKVAGHGALSIAVVYYKRITDQDGVLGQ